MPQQPSASVENNFIRGHITEATGLNFPENAAQEIWNCEIDNIARVTRRKGIDLEDQYDVLTVSRAGKAIVGFLWENVSGDGNTTLYVLQIGPTLYFYDVSSVTSLSLQKLTTTVALGPYKPSGAADPDSRECQFAIGPGHLFVTHPTVEPLYLSYDSSTQTVTATAITVKIRDFEGLEDSLDTDERPSSLSTAHSYNLRNQGWTDRELNVFNTATFTQAGTTSSGNTAVTGSVTDKIAVGMSVSGTGIPGGATVAAIVSPTAWTLSANASASGANDHAFGFVGVYPSNADVTWLFKNSTNVFDPANTAHGVYTGNTPAPKGKFILDAFDQDRDAASGLSGITDVTTTNRPTTVAFFQGRVFYSGVEASGFENQIYFTQVVEDEKQYGLCYQKNDPSSEEIFDLGPADGGIIKVLGCGTIFKLMAIQGGLLIFTSTGIRQITGSDATGFSATDYTVAIFSEVETQSATSFVNLFGYPVWWNSEGIYTIKPNESRSGLIIESLTEKTIKQFYQAIPPISKKHAKGAFDLVSKTLVWIYSSEAQQELEDRYNFDRALIFNLNTGAFFHWSFDTSNVMINEITLLDTIGGTLTLDQVVNSGGDHVIDASANNVIVYGSIISEAVLPEFKFVVSMVNGANHDFTFADEDDTSYRDWVSFDDVGVDFESYLITGFRIKGQAQLLWQNNYLYLFSQNSEATQYKFQARWDYATSGDTGDWTSTQTLSHTGLGRSYDRKRIRVRGQGEVLQFKLSSVSGQPFALIGWSAAELVNAIP